MRPFLNTQFEHLPSIWILAQQTLKADPCTCLLRKLTDDSAHRQSEQDTFSSNCDG